VPKPNTTRDGNSGRVTNSGGSAGFSVTRPGPPRTDSKAGQAGLPKRRVGRPGNVGIPRSRTPEYRAYSDAKSRCQNPNHQHYKLYGGRGTEFRFTSFAEFFAAVGGRRPSPKHALSRQNTDGHYEVGNIRWAVQRGRPAQKAKAPRTGLVIDPHLAATVRRPFGRSGTVKPRMRSYQNQPHC
jgi:hypothetical protein